MTLMHFPAFDDLLRNWMDVGEGIDIYDMAGVNKRELSGLTADTDLGILILCIL